MHPFREGNTRTIVILITFFVEHHGYYFDKMLMAESAGYVRNSLVLASLGENSEYEHLNQILCDAILDGPVDYNNDDAITQLNKKDKYKTEDYTPAKHEYIE